MPESQPATFAEIRRLIPELPGPDTDARANVEARQALLAKPRGSLGRLESLAAWLAAWQGQHPPRARVPHVAVFAGNHGVAAQGVSAYPRETTARMVQAFIEGHGAINQICAQLDTDLRVYEMALDEPTADLTETAAMTEDECARAIASGMLAVDGAQDVMALGEMGIGNTTCAAALAAARFGGDGALWAGPGTGLDDAGVARKARAVDAALATHAGALDDPLEALRRLGGLELAAIAGAVLACRLARVPVVLDGFAATAAAATLTGLDAGVLDHCVIAHRSAEPGHARLLSALGTDALLDLEMRLGEASGAALALPVLQSACACHAGMASMADLGLEASG